MYKQRKIKYIKIINLFLSVLTNIHIQNLWLNIKYKNLNKL